MNTPQGERSTEIVEVDEPTPTPDEVVVAVRAFAVNRGELSLLAARPQGWRPGQDIAGEVLTPAADGSGPAVGARVVGWLHGAGWAQRAAVPTGRLAELPTEVSYQQAATLPIAGLTALRTLRIGGDLLGRRVLLTGANGGVGRFQVELAAAAGARVTAVSGRPEAGDELRALGAEQVVGEVKDAEGLFDLIVESVGGASLGATFGKARPGGVIVSIGVSSGEPTPFNLFDFVGHEDARLVTFFSYASTDPTDVDLRLLLELIAAGRLHPTVGFVEHWSELEDALTRLRERTLPGGKAVLTVS